MAVSLTKNAVDYSIALYDINIVYRLMGDKVIPSTIATVRLFNIIGYKEAEATVERYQDISEIPRDEADVIGIIRNNLKKLYPAHEIMWDVEKSLVVEDTPTAPITPAMAVAINERIQQAEGEWKEATRIKIAHKNHILGAIFVEWKEQYPEDWWHKEVKVIEDTANKWAIHVNQKYYNHMFGVIDCVRDQYEFKWTGADTDNPDIALFCTMP